MKPANIGIVGCGAISGIYLTNIAEMFGNITVRGVCDLVDEKAEYAARQYNVRKYRDMHEIFADAEIDIVLNLTRPYEHFDVTVAAINAGKHVYSEKPLGATLDEGTKLRDAAAKNGVCIAGAPDTFLGAGIQTCKKLIDDGFIGHPVSATAFMACPGHEHWHPDPAFYYQFGGGPMLDMGPYYITALVELLGRVRNVSGMVTKAHPTRTITSKEKYGTVVEVEVPTHVTGQMAFESGAVATMVTSFDVRAHNLPIIEIYGTEGTLTVPDPNGFGGPVLLFRPQQGEFLQMPLMYEHSANCRGLGLSEMAAALRAGRKPRAGVDLTYHVLEVMTAFTRSSDSKAHVEIGL